MKHVRNRDHGIVETVHFTRRTYSEDSSIKGQKGGEQHSTLQTISKVRTYRTALVLLTKLYI